MSEVADPSEAAFMAALFGEDELGVAVRAHIHIEARLLELLDLVVMHHKSLKKMNLDYNQRVNLAVALGLDPELAPALLALGSLRNAFAHRLDMELSESRVNNLYQALSGSDKEMVQAAYNRTKDQLRVNAPPFGQLTPKERFILISVALRGILLTAISDIRMHRPRSNEGMEPTR
jgi:hypothetical protein